MDCLLLADGWSNSKEHTSCFQVSSIHDWLLLLVCAVRIINLLIGFSLPILLILAFMHLHALVNNWLLLLRIHSRPQKFGTKAWLLLFQSITGFINCLFDSFDMCRVVYMSKNLNQHKTLGWLFYDLMICCIYWFCEKIVIFSILIMLALIQHIPTNK